MFAIDFDGTIADTNTLKSLWIQEHLGLQIPPYACDMTICVNKIGIDQYMKMAAEVYKADRSLQALPVSGSSAAIRALCNVGPIYVVTARDQDELPFVSEWLSQQELGQFISQLMPANGVSKISLAETLNCKVLIDDDIRHLVPDSSRALLKILLKVGLYEEMKVPPDVTLCKTWRLAAEKALAFCRND